MPIPSATRRVPTFLLVIGWILTVVFPIGALVIGIFCYFRGEEGHGIGMIVIAVLFIVVFMAIASGG
jgi:uncharacterized ion transporter superfamily protein YfcC